MFYYNNNNPIKLMIMLLHRIEQAEKIAINHLNCSDCLSYKWWLVSFVRYVRSLVENALDVAPAWSKKGRRVCT